MESILIQLFFSAFGSKQKKNKYHGTFIPSKSKLYSKPGILIFLLFWSWSLALYFHVWVK